MRRVVIASLGACALAVAIVVPVVAIGSDGFGAGGSSATTTSPARTSPAATSIGPTSVAPTASPSPSPTATAEETPPTPPGEFPYQAELAAYLSTRPGSVSVSMRRHPSEPMLTYTKGEASNMTASIIKVSIMAAVMKRAQDDGRSLTASEKARMERMIRVSDNDATTSLWAEVGRGPAVLAVMTEMGATGTKLAGLSWARIVTTAPDQVRVMEHFTYPNDVISKKNRAYGLSLLTDVDDSQDWGATAGHDPDDVAVKNGWRPQSGGWLVNSVGSVAAPNPVPFTIAVLTLSSKGTFEGQIKTIEEVTRIVYDHERARPVTG